MSRSTIPGLQTCAASSETGVEKRRNAVFSSARRVWLVVQPPRTVCFPWAQFFAKFDAIICARPCSAQPTATNCPAPSRRATTPLSRPARAVGNSSHPEPPSDRFHSKLQWFLFNCLASAVECVIARLNQVSVFIHPMATFSSVLSAAKEPRLQFCCGGVVRGAPSSSAPKYEMSLPQCQVLICHYEATTRVRNVWFSPLAPQPTVRVPCVTSKWKSPSAVLQLDSRRTATTWLVSLDTRCESQLQAGLGQLRRRARTAST